MNIGTSALLSMLSPKLNDTIKDKIDLLSKNGNIDIKSALKDKTIQSALTDMFKDISNGIKTKNQIQELLKNSKNLYDLKTVSNDLKSILLDIQSNPKLEKQTTILKEFLVNIKNLDENILKNNIANSGVFLESKISIPQKIQSNDIFKTLLLNIKQLQEKQIEPKTVNIIKDILKDLDSQITKSTTNNTEIKENKDLKTDISKLLTQIQTIENTPRQEIQQHLLKSFRNDISFLETKIANNNIFNMLNPISINSSDYFTKDIKVILLQIQEQIQKETKNTDEFPKELKTNVEKLLTQIDFYQLHSYSANSNISYLPFVWENLEDGEIKFDKKEDDSVSCQINLTLKSFGELKTLLQLDKNNNLLINISVEQIALKEKIQQNLQILRLAINNIGLKLQGLNLFDMIQNNQKTYQEQAYQSNSHIDFGLDVKV